MPIESSSRCGCSTGWVRYRFADNAELIGAWASARNVMGPFRSKSGPEVPPGSGCAGGVIGWWRSRNCGAARRAVVVSGLGPARVADFTAVLNVCGKEDDEHAGLAEARNVGADEHRTASPGRTSTPVHG